MIFALLTTLFFAATSVCGTQSARLLGAARANALRLLTATLILGTFALALGDTLAGRPWLFALAGAIGFGLGGFCMFQALPRLGPTLSMLGVQCASTVAATIIAWLWLKETLTPPQIVAAISILTGVILGMAPRIQREIRPRDLRHGLLWVLAAAIYQGISMNLSRYAFLSMKAAGEDMPQMIMPAFQRLCGGVIIGALLFGLTQLLRPLRPAPPDAKPRSAPAPGFQRVPAWGWVLANALFGPVLGVTTMLWALRFVTPGVVQTIIATTTLVTIPLAWPVERKLPPSGYYVGATLAIAGVASILLVS